jgi:hypothetical protein
MHGEDGVQLGACEGAACGGADITYVEAGGVFCTSTFVPLLATQNLIS